jgi:putative Mg2+ transporter-C (MgtC) family protein
MEQSLPSLTEVELVTRVVLALILCAMIGFERELRGQVAGLRTHILVGVGAALFTILSAYGFNEWVRANPSGGALVSVDPTRIAAQIVAGIGFLGAGAIITQGVTVRGLTTAAALWIAAAIGMACGAGAYTAAIVTTLAVIISLVGVRHLRPLWIHRLRSEIVVIDIRMKSRKKVRSILAVLSDHKASVQSMTQISKRQVRFEILLPGDADISGLEDRIEATKGISLRSMRTARADAFGDDE